MRSLVTKERVLGAAARSGLGPIAEKVMSGARLTVGEIVNLYNHPDLNAIGAIANWKREQLHGDRTYFNVNQHINYTNICNKLCRFCAFQRLPGQEGAYVFSPEEAARKIKETLSQAVTEVHMVAGIDPKLPYSYYLDLLRAVKAARPEIHIKAFTMVEIEQIQKVAKKPLEEVFDDLKNAGLGSLPGGGAEIFAERVHKLIFPLKIGAARWLEIAKTAHRCGLKTNCTMLYGHIETPEEKADHLNRLRLLQDETGGFQTFIPLTFHPDNTDLNDIPAPTAIDDLREIAVARLALDNIPHIKAYWIQLGLSTAQTALSYGADDLDGTVKEERIYHDAGADTPQELGREELVNLIYSAGRHPVERDTLYQIVREEPLAQAPGVLTN
ncbi:MAG: aminofutalosine synthase MqnE [Planctomycetota bacterium]